MSTPDHQSGVGYVAGHLRSGGSPARGVRDSPGVRTEQHRLSTSYTEFAGLPEADGETTAAVVQRISLYGHAVDNSAWVLLRSVFSAQSAIDDGQQVHEGVDALIAALRGRPASPAHHTVNTVVKSLDDGRVCAWSRLITIAPDGSVASADVVDIATRTGDDWLVDTRVVHPRHGGAPGIEDGAAPWAP